MTNIDAAVPGSMRMTEALHTMGPLLPKYVLPKVPSKSVLSAAQNVVLSTEANLSTFSSAGKHGHKTFNWRRPVFRVEGRTLQCTLPPGVDYYYHYARLIETAASLYEIELQIDAGESEDADVYDFVSSLVRRGLDRADVVVLGYVEQLFSRHPTTTRWEIESGVGYRRVKIGACNVLLIGFELSYWGDVGGRLVEVLADLQITDWVIYVGKLGSLQAEHTPNLFIATGTSSILNGVMHEWESRLVLDSHQSSHGVGLLTGQRHITEQSTIDESVAWRSSNKDRVELVDPEIGRMAAAAQGRQISFDYLHIVSDNLAGGFEQGLFDEHFGDVKQLRSYCLTSIEDVLTKSFLNLN